MKKLSLVLGAGWILGAMQGCGSSERNGPAEAPEFSSSVAGDKILENLSANEVEAVCRDIDAFINQTAVRTDNCRMLGVLTAAFTAEFSADTSDAELRTICSDSYEACTNDETVSDEACEANEFSENCAASVSEYGACLEDTFGEFHRLVQELPSCTTLTRQNLSESSSASTGFRISSSCEAFQLKCPGISEAAADFVGEYCGRISPCCSEAGLGDDCEALTIQAAQDMHFDADVAADCLARLEQYQADPGYCSGVGQGSYTSEWSAAIPQCEGVFSGSSDSAGAPAGAACDWDDDCAGGESGLARCVPTTSVFEHICAPITKGSAGDPCLGTVAEFDGTLTEWSGGVATAAGGALCYHSDNLRCDEQTGTCIGVGDLGDACTSTLECPSDAYCDPSGVCATRLVEGAPCDDYFGECAGEADCDATSQKCTLPLPAGATCPEDGSTPCASGFCLDAVCTHPLARVCGEPAGR